jgi:hypothetical protein
MKNNGGDAVMGIAQDSYVLRGERIDAGDMDIFRQRYQWNPRGFREEYDLILWSLYETSFFKERIERGITLFDLRVLERDEIFGNPSVLVVADGRQGDNPLNAQLIQARIEAGSQYDAFFLDYREAVIAA